MGTSHAVYRHRHDCFRRIDGFRAHRHDETAGKRYGKKAEIEALRNDDAFMSELLGNGTTTPPRERKVRQIIATSITSEKTK